MQAIKNRYSVREFTDQKISKEDLVDILNHATLAPSLKNTQPWFMTVLSGKAKADFTQLFAEKTADAPSDVENSSNKISLQAMQTADKIVLVWNTDERNWEGLDHSCAALIQNVLLKATDLDIGSLWVGDVLNIKADIQTYFKRKDKLIGAIALGYAKETLKYRGRKALDKVYAFFD